MEEGEGALHALSVLVEMTPDVDLHTRGAPGSATNRTRKMIHTNRRVRGAPRVQGAPYVLVVDEFFEYVLLQKLPHCCVVRPFEFRDETWVVILRQVGEGFAVSEK